MYNYVPRGTIQLDIDSETQLLQLEREALELLAPNLRVLVGRSVAPTPLLEYVRRVLHYSRCTEESFIITLCYMDRLSNMGFPITPRSVHRVFLTCVLLAIKYREETYFPTLYYSQVGGLPLAELRQMEVAVLTLLGFDCGVTPEEYLGMLLQLNQW